MTYMGNLFPEASMGKLSDICPRRDKLGTCLRGNPHVSVDTIVLHAVQILKCPAMQHDHELIRSKREHQVTLESCRRNR